MNNLEDDIKANFLTFISTESDLKHAIQSIQIQTENYIQKHAIKSLVLGISGGIDSAFAAALLRPVCDRMNIPLIGRSISIETNTSEEIERSILVGESFCHDFSHMDYSNIYMHFKNILPELDNSLLSKLRTGNCKARIRMIALYDLAQKNQGIVISTDNFTEYLTGFWTLHGDVGDYAPFAQLWKTEVYLASKLLANQNTGNAKKALHVCIDAVPTDGLGISLSDTEQLGVSNYDEADTIFINYFNGDISLENHVLIKRYFASSYKRSNPIMIERKNLLNKH
ncbi:MAG: NAD(+) synthase [Bacteroidales bacterium]|jgi:NAD+ synthetase|nr:NAD(+) synthase [Bacteroidales bacterium]MDX9890555.1 NAD(+) synthase [Bacteroidales bacterium]NLO42152.1 NAD(+) synthase [Bacteroidales bacterium]